MAQDVSDHQYAFFRNSITYLGILLLVHPNLRKLYNKVYPLPPGSASPKPTGSSYISLAEGEAKLEQRASFDFKFALVFLSALHGFSVFKILAILYINYAIATTLPRKYIPAATWIYNIGTLFANELTEGYRLEKMAQYFAPLASQVSVSLLHSSAKWIDTFPCIAKRWEVLFNLTVLRLISFNLDYYWSLDRRSGSPVEVCLQNPFYLALLREIRRSNSIQRIYQKEIVSQLPPLLKTTIFVTSLHMLFMHPFI